jgi:hypothetical protein
MREWKLAVNKNMMPCGGPWKRPIFLLFHSPPLCNLLEGSLLVQIHFPYSLSLSGPFPLAFLPPTLYNPNTSQLCHFSPEDGNSMFLWNIGIDLWIHMAKVPKPKIIPTSQKITQSFMKITIRSPSGSDKWACDWFTASAVQHTLLW